jgi:hypothetical protein
MNGVTTEHIFFYGSEGTTVPQDVTHARVDSTRIRDFAFNWCRDLVDVELLQGLEIIGIGAFRHAVALTRVSLPASVRQIPGNAFNSCISLVGVELSEGLQSIERHAFDGCISIKNMKVPSTVTELGMRSFYRCESLASVELSEQGLKRIGAQAFEKCKSLKNIVLRYTVDDIGDGDMFEGCDLIVNQFQNADEVFIRMTTRLDELPLHKLCYYQPYYKDTKFNNAVKNIIASNEASGNSVDLFGMTSMHILAMSSRLSLELLRALLLKHQENLVTVDNWECLPVDYACTLNAPIEIIQLLLDTQLMVFPDRKPNWKKLVSTANMSASLEVIQYLVRLSITDRLNHLGLEQWQLEVSSSVEDILEDLTTEVRQRQRQIDWVYSRLKWFEQKEAISLLELALWKAKLDVSTSDHMQLNAADRSKYRINCGDEIVISNVLPFLGYDLLVEESE